MENGINKISVYGDSILKGAVTGMDSGHLFDIIPNNSMAIASEALGFELNNQSVFGNIITKGCRKLLKDISKDAVGDLAIIESGSNDSDYDWAPVCETPSETHNPRVTLEEYLKTLHEMVKTLREHKVTPLIMTLVPLVGDSWYEHICNSYNRDAVVTFTKGVKERLYLNQERYQNALLKYALTNNVQIVDMRDAFLEREDYRSLMCKDGIHPNEKGYEYMAEIWIRELPKIKKEF